MTKNQTCHWPKRGDVIEAWLIEEKTRHTKSEALDAVLEAYREIADAGSGIHRVNCDGCHCIGLSHREDCPVEIEFQKACKFPY